MDGTFNIGPDCNADSVKSGLHFRQSSFRNRLCCARWNYKRGLEYLWSQLDGDAGCVWWQCHRKHRSTSQPVIAVAIRSHHLLVLLYGGLTGFFMLNRSLVEEFRKTLCSLWQGSQTAFSPDSLFYTIWKIMPSFRLISIRRSCNHILLLHLYIYFNFIFVRRGYQQQDAHEFMRYLLDHLHRELQYGRNGASHASSPQDGVRLSAADGKCCMYVNKFIINIPWMSQFCVNNLTLKM